MSSVCEGAGYDEVSLLSHGPEEGSSWPLEREPSTHCPDEKEDFDGEGVEEEDEYDEGEGEGENEEEYEGEGNKEKRENEEEYEGEGDRCEDKGDERAFEEGSLGSSSDGHTHPFILPAIWMVNEFKLTMMTNIFKTLWDRY